MAINTKSAHRSLQNMFHTTTNPLQTILHILQKHAGGENIHLHVSDCKKQILIIPIIIVPGLCLLPVT